MAYDKALAVKAAAETGVPLDILERVISAESSGDPKAVSPKGAHYGEGLTQLSEGTASDMGVTDRLDPEQNIIGGAKYLKAMYDQFGSWPLAEAAYVAGPRRVKEAGGVPKSAASYVKKVGGQMADGSAGPTSTGLAGDTLDPKVTAAADDLMQEGLKSFKGSEGEYDAASAKAKSAVDERLKRIDAEEARINDLSGYLKKLNEQVPAAPAEQRLPAYQPPAQTNPMKSLAAALPMLLLTSGKMGRNKGLALMTTMGAMLNGVDAGNEEKRKQYQEDFLHQTQQAVEQARLDHERYAEILQTLQQDASLATSQAALLATERGLDEDRVAAASGDLKYVQDKMNIAAKFIETGGGVLSQAIQAHRAAIADARSQATIQIERDKLDESRRYHDQLGGFRSKKFAQSLRKEVAATQQGKAYTALEQFGPVIDEAAAKLARGEALGSQTQGAFLDAFTRIVTGGQAIRGFTLKLNTDHAGLADKANVFIQKLKTGGPLSPRQEKEMIDVINEYRGEVEKAYDAEVQRSAQELTDPEVSAESAVPLDVNPAKALGGAAPAAPPVGTVDGGHRFKGGDPSKAENWEPVS